MKPKIDLNKISKLAQMNISESEKTMFETQMQGILDFVSKLSELDTNGVEPTASTMQSSNVVREDTNKPSFENEEALLNSPEKKAGFFKIPKIME
jgi:aspartyl-tRNA(Asn)/glutamyl-tRNA(Gln) amidotransferase subunit C